MVEAVSLLLVLMLTLLIARIAAVALTLTGLSRASAQFQARSALTGAGFATAEAEAVMNHPVRRRIIMWLMLIGNGGLVVLAALMVAMVAGNERGGSGLFWKLSFLLVGVAALWLVASSKWVDRWLSRAIERALRRYSDLDTRDYAGLLHLRGDYQVVELAVAEGDWLAGRTLQQLNLSREGVLVLAIDRPGDRFIGAPRGNTAVEPGDTLLLYGRENALAELDQREAGATGNYRHIEAIAKQKQEEAKAEAEAEGTSNVERSTSNVE